MYLEVMSSLYFVNRLPGSGIPKTRPNMSASKSNSFAVIGSTNFCDKQSNIFNLSCHLASFLKAL